MTMMEVALTTTARFKCTSCDVRYFLAGKVETVYSDLHHLKEAHNGCMPRKC